MISYAKSPIRQRTCLKCGLSFLSQSPANRICSECTQINNQLHLPEAALQRERGAKRHRGEVINKGRYSLLDIDL